MTNPTATPTRKVVPRHTPVERTLRDMKREHEITRMGAGVQDATQRPKCSPVESNVSITKRSAKHAPKPTAKPKKSKKRDAEEKPLSLADAVAQFPVFASRFILSKTLSEAVAGAVPDSEGVARQRLEDCKWIGRNGPMIVKAAEEKDIDGDKIRAFIHAVKWLRGTQRLNDLWDLAALDVDKLAERVAKASAGTDKEILAAEMALEYGISKGQISKATKLPPNDPMHLDCRHDGRNVFIPVSIGKKWAQNYEARRDGRQRSGGVLGKSKTVREILKYAGEEVNRHKEAE